MHWLRTHVHEKIGVKSWVKKNQMQFTIRENLQIPLKLQHSKTCTATLNTWQQMVVRFIHMLCETCCFSYLNPVPYTALTSALISSIFWLHNHFCLLYVINQWLGLCLNEHKRGNHWYTRTVRNSTCGISSNSNTYLKNVDI